MRSGVIWSKSIRATISSSPRVAKAGIEDGVELIAGSCIIDPQGQILARAATRGDELIVARIDFDQMTPLRKRWNFLGRRQPQHYGEMLRPVTEKEPHR